MSRGTCPSPSHRTRPLRQALTALIEIAIVLDHAQDAIDDLDAHYRGRHRADVLVTEGPEGRSSES